MTPDVGVLSCGTGEMCVEDSTSQFGGRCVALEETVAVQRELQCMKCSGFKACPVGVNQTNIGCGSCIGDWTCSDLPDNTMLLLVKIHVWEMGPADKLNGVMWQHLPLEISLVVKIMLAIIWAEGLLAVGAVLNRMLVPILEGLLGTTHVMERGHAEKLKAMLATTVGELLPSEE
eukprot:scaffold26765_cov64-Cyclotella_meneghiniana.AAC.3